MSKSFFSKVSKMGDVKIVRIPFECADSYESGEFVVVEVIDPSEVKKALKSQIRGKL